MCFHFNSIYLSIFGAKSQTESFTSWKDHKGFTQEKSELYFIETGFFIFYNDL